MTNEQLGILLRDVSYLAHYLDLILIIDFGMGQAWLQESAMENDRFKFFTVAATWEIALDRLLNKLLMEMDV